MQVEPIKPKLKAPGAKRLKLNSDQVLSSFACKFNLRRYIKGSSGGLYGDDDEEEDDEVGLGRCCLPRHRMPFNASHEGSKCVG